MQIPHLEAEKQRLLDCIVEIRQSGTVAEALYYVTVVPVAYKNKTYYYARLVREEKGKKPKVTPLGRQGSSKHRDWARRIARRDAIVELEQQLSLLTQLMDRQRDRSHLVNRDFSNPEDEG